MRLRFSFGSPSQPVRGLYHRSSEIRGRRTTTRDEAIAKGAAAELLGKGAPTSYTNKVFANNVVAVLEAIGMLKFDEPKNPADEKFKEIYRSWPLGWQAQSCLDDLKAKGLKIVEK